MGIWMWCLTIFQLYRGGQFKLAEDTGVHGENHRPAPNH